MARRASLAFVSPRRIIASMRVRREATSANSAATKNALSATSTTTAPSLSSKEPDAGSFMSDASYVAEGRAESRDHHGHGHARLRAESGSRALAWALGITLVFAAVEAVGGLVAHSLALLADATHMLMDAAALALALFAAWIARRP